MSTKESEQWETVVEGKAKMLLPDRTVFYNPAQEFNRDLSISVLRTFVKIKAEVSDEEALTVDSNDAFPPEKKRLKTDKTGWSKGLRVLEALAASGLRSVRFALEVPGLKTVVANDFSESAMTWIKRNIEGNN
ncbi:unnamed protein product, partial [Soboliphyme baturini]|uniref:tRNA (guanine(26)-N(2))-dimethyltransferase n=1 Tax=Soboliphyme baturini TaxID=241478 RepID=A0A183J7D7_9BILA